MPRTHKRGDAMMSTHKRRRQMKSGRKSFLGAAANASARQGVCSYVCLCVKNSLVFNI